MSEAVSSLKSLPNFATIASCVGNTPLVKLQRLPGNTSNTVLVKLEGNNPAGSVKDRPVLSMIERAEARGDIQPGDTLIEATSGNTGIALAMVAAVKGYTMKLIMPSHMTQERKDAMAAIAREYGLYFVIRGDCPYCHEFAPYLRRFAAAHGFTVIAVTLAL